MKPKKTKFLVPALIFILVASTLAWSLSQSGFLLGRFSTSPIDSGLYTPAMLDAMTTDELVTGAETQMNNAEGFESNASDAEAAAIAAYNEQDEEALVAAQADATDSAESADTAATLAERFADELLSRYGAQAISETYDFVTGGVNVQQLLQDAGDRYESSKIEYEIVFEPYWEYLIEDPYIDATDQIPTETYVIDEWPTEIITQTDFWTDYTIAREDYLGAYNELAGLLEIGELTDANTSYLEGIQAYEAERLEFETSVIEYSINQTVLNSSVMQNMGTGFNVQMDALQSSQYTSLSTQMGAFLSTQALFETTELDITNFQINQSLFNNYSYFQNNVTGAVELASTETAAELYAAYELAEGYAISARASATLADAYATSASLYEILNCLSLMVTPTTYVMDSTEVTAEFPIIAAVSLTPTVSGTYASWSGTLSFTSTRAGTFDQGSTSSNPLNISMTSAGTQVVNFSGGVSGDTITVQVVGEPICMQTITISQAAATMTTEAAEDSDGDGLTDTEEADLGTDPNDTDSDDDRLDDYEEVFTYGTNPLDEDSDTDGLDDYEEIFTYETDPLDPDSDGDKLDDYEEIFTYGTDPNDTDTDDDGLSDYDEVMVYDSDPLDATSGIPGTCNSLSLSPSTLELDEDESSTIEIEVDIDGTWDGDVYVVWSDNDAYVTSDDGEVHTSEFAGEGPLTTGTYYVLYTSGGNSGTEDETETFSISLEGSSCTDTISITIPAENTLNATEDCEEDYEDIEEDDWFAETVCRLTEAGYVEGREQYSYYSLFYPADEITKAETLKLISLILLDLDEDDAEGGSSDFTDPNLTTEWYYWAVVNTEAEDVLRTRDAGTIGNFNTDITRGELAVYIARALGLTAYSYTSEYSDVDEDDWFAYAIALLSRTDDEYIKDMPYDGSDEELPVLEGYTDDTFRPYDDINRAEALTMIYRAYQIYIAD